MALVDGDILRIVSQLALPESVIAQNVFYALFNDTGGSNDDLDVVDDITDYIDDLYTPIVTRISEDVLLDVVNVYKRDIPGDDWDEVGAGIPTTLFTNVDTMIAHGLAVLMHGYTTDPDVRGSKYFAGLADVENTESNISGGSIAAFVTLGGFWVDSFVGAATGADFDPGIWSPTRDAFYQFVDHYSVNGFVAYQRRRKPGVGI